MKDDSPAWLPWLIMVLLAFTWGSSFILMKYSLYDSSGAVLYSPVQVACIRLSVAGLVLLPLSLKRLVGLTNKEIGFLLMVAFFGNGLPAFLFTYAQQYLPSAYVGMLNSLVPLFTLVLGLLLFQAKVKRVQALGVGIGLIGAVGLILAGGKVNGEVNNFAWLIVLATACYAISLNTIGHKLKHMNPVKIAAVALLFAGLPCGIYLFSTDYVIILTENPEGWKGMMFASILAIFGTALALVFFNQLVHRGGTLFASSVTYIIPLFAVMWGVIDGESITFLQVLAGLVILSGVYLVNRGKASK